jgi:hypothetical protein
MSTSALEEKVTRNLTQTRALDAEFEAFTANTRPRGPGGSAAGGAYYNSSEVRLQAIEPAQARGVHQMLREQLEKQGATHFEYMAPEGARQFAAPWDSQNFDGVPLAVQYATAAILSAGPSLRGAETDMRVPFKGGGAELVTVWNDDAAHIEAAAGTDASLPAVATGPPQAEAVRAHYGTGPIDGWSASELASLERALALLSPQELAAISGLPFRRGSSAPSDPPKPPPGLLSGEGKQCGAFRLKPGDTRIEIYDCAFQSEATGFVGGTDRPLPPSVRAILHEIGHAIAKRRVAELSSRMFASYGESSELAVEFNRQGKRIDPSQLNRYKKMQEQIAEISATVGRWQVALNGGASSLSPVLEQFDQVRGQTGFTAYGRWNSDEAFAEAFSLYRADPAACKRISPPVFAYFDSGRHAAASP